MLLSYLFFIFQLSDLDILKQKNEIQNNADGTYDALVLQMSLRSSMYATMAIRELTRMDTGKTYQSKLTSEHQEVDKNLNGNNSGTKRSIDDVDNPSSDSLPKLPKIEEDAPKVEMKSEPQ